MMDMSANIEQSKNEAACTALAAFFESLTPAKLGEFGRYYTADACFKDPFNEVRGLAAIACIFAHMYRQLASARFVVHERVVDAQGAMLIWTLQYRTAAGRPEEAIRGASHVKFDADGKVSHHRDYWDAAEELYAKQPLLGSLMRFLQRKLRAG